MLLDTYRVVIPEGLEDSQGYVHMAQGQIFSIVPSNLDRTRRCNAVLTVNGEHRGTFRLNRAGLAGDSMRIIHAHDSQQLFTAFAEASTAGQIVGAAATTQAGGLIEVQFIPELLSTTRPIFRKVAKDPDPQRWPSARYPYEVYPLNARSGESEPVMYAGIAEATDPPAQPLQTAQAATVALTGHTDHRYRHAAEMPLDHARAVTIRLRIVIQPDLTVPPPPPID